jgi:hypothetical protein
MSTRAAEFLAAPSRSREPRPRALAAQCFLDCRNRGDDFLERGWVDIDDLLKRSRINAFETARSRSRRLTVGYHGSKAR